MVANDLRRADLVVRVGEAEAPAGEELASLEVRWILPGLVPAAIETWLGPFAGPHEHRRDRYLLQGSPTLGVKVKNDMQLDIKMFQGCVGRLGGDGEPEGDLERWRRWSFPIVGGLAAPTRDAGWLPIEKVRRRRWFSSSDGRAIEVATLEEADCAMELTDLSIGGRYWWTVAFETKRDTAEMPVLLQRVVRSVFATTPPGEAASLFQVPSIAYPRWLLGLG